MSKEVSRRERAAMWLYHKEYAAQAVGAIAFYAGLGQYEKNRIDDMLDELVPATKAKAAALLRRWLDVINGIMEKKGEGRVCIPAEWNRLTADTMNYLDGPKGGGG